MINRRRLVFTGASMPILFTSAGGFATAQGGSGPKIGHSRKQFDAWFGPGASMDEFIHYPPLQQERASYYVAFDENKRAKKIIGDFNGIENGGIPFDWDEAGKSQFVHDDATPSDLFQFVYFKTAGGYYTLRSWQSSELAAETGGSGYVSVLDRITSGMTDPTLFRETMITTETAEVNPIIPTGQNLGPHSTMQDWIAYNNNVSLMSEAGLVLDNPPIPGFWVIMDSMQIWAEPDPAIPTQEAAQLISSMLPLSDLLWTTWYGTSPVTDTQIRLHEFVSRDTGEHYLSAQFVNGDEQNGTVSRFYLTPVRK